jgi:hypothetical protein
MKFLKLALTLLLSLLGLLPVSALATNLLINPGLNDPYTPIAGRVWNGVNESIAGNWQAFYIPAGTYDGYDRARKLHWFSSLQFAQAFGGGDYHIEGNRAQNMWSSYEFDAGIYQQILGLNPGQAYGFDIGMVTYWRGPGYPDSDGKMVKQVGLDPTGGTDPTNPNVIWSQTDANDKAWVYLDVAAAAQGSTMTVFARVQAPDNQSYNHTDLDMVYFEAAHFAPVPTTNLNITPSGTIANLTWSSSAPAAGWSLKGYEVQYRDLTESDWITLQNKNNSDTSGSFTGLPGHTYLVRARAWQKITQTYEFDLPGLWDEETVTLGAVVNGRVMTNRGDSISGLTVSEGSGSATAITGSDGFFTLGLTNSGSYTITVANIGGWTAPPSAPVLVQLNTTTPLSFTLHPPDDVIINGNFENNLTGWHIEGNMPDFINTGQRSGAYSLRLTQTVTLSQTGFITNAYQPGLSFWYRQSGGYNNAFTAQILGANELNPLQIIDLANNGVWQHVWLPLNQGKVYTGPVAVQFSLVENGATVDLDEVSLGSSWGGPNEVFLPVIFR